MNERLYHELRRQGVSDREMHFYLIDGLADGDPRRQADPGGGQRSPRDSQANRPGLEADAFDPDDVAGDDEDDLDDGMDGFTLDEHPPMTTAGHVHSGLAPHMHADDNDHTGVAPMIQCGEVRGQVAARDDLQLAESRDLQRQAERLARSEQGKRLGELEPAAQRELYQSAARMTRYGR